MGGGYVASCSFNGRSLTGIKGLQPLLAGVAYLDALAPLRVQDLVGTDTPGRVRVEDAVDDVAAAGLFGIVSTVQEA